MKSFKRFWSIISTVIVVLAVLLAVALAGVRLLGFQVYTVLSGSMEPTYHVGSLIYVKKVDPADVKVGDPITFVLNEDLVVATHRVVDIKTDDQGAIRFITKGDANDTADGGDGVHQNNLLGKPVFTIPYLGYLSSYIQHPPGTYLAIAVGAVLLLLVFLPDLLGAILSNDKGKAKKEEQEQKT